MKNTLTYHTPWQAYESQRSLLSMMGERHPGSQMLAYHDPDLYIVSKLFKDALRQHGLTMGSDIKFEVHDAIKFEANSEVDLKAVTLTFADEATALMFKLSHDGGAQ